MKNIKRLFLIIMCAIMLLSTAAFASDQKDTQAKVERSQKLSWDESVKESMALFDDGGGYYTGFSHPAGFTQNTWEGMDRAFQLGKNDVKPTIDVSKARPSFCSSAIYMLLLKSISLWDNDRSDISRNAWVNLKPYTLTKVDQNGNVIETRQDDGYGCWGRANANGPGLAVLVNELGAGKNYYIGNKSEYRTEKDYYKAWDQAKPYDFMKIFWNDGIGCDNNNPAGDERGHMVLYLGKITSYDENGNRDDMIYWWSSNGSKTDINAGYGIKKCRESQIYRAVLTRITDPQKFNNADMISKDNVNQWLSDLNGKNHGTVEELKSFCGIKDQKLRLIIGSK